MAVERKPVKRLLEVLAEAALTRAAAPRHLGEVHASGGCEKSSMVSMMNVRKDLLKFVMVERAAAIISLSWISGLIFMYCNLKCGNSKLLKIKHLFNFSSIIFAIC